MLPSMLKSRSTMLEVAVIWLAGATRQTTAPDAAAGSMRKTVAPIPAPLTVMFDPNVTLLIT